MNNPLNELSAVYNQSIAEGCGCDDKKKAKVKAEMLPQGDSPMGGDGARPGKNRKAYVEPMSNEGYAPGDVDQKVGAVTAIPKSDREAAKARLLAKAKAKRAMKEGHCKECEGDPCECSPEEKKRDSKRAVKEHVSWRDELREYVGDPAEVDNVTKSSPKKDTEAAKEIKEKNIKNKIKINPPQGVTEGFQELGGVIVGMYELTEADMTGAPSIKDAKPIKKIKVKYDPKMKVMAPQINKEETDKEKKKREMLTKTKDHDDKHDGKMASEEMSVKDQMAFSREYNRKKKEGLLPKRPVAKPVANTDTRSASEKMADAYASPRKGPGGATRAD